MPYRKTRWEVQPEKVLEPEQAPPAQARAPTTVQAPAVAARDERSKQLALVIPTFLIVVGLIGWGNTPHGADGRPYLLSSTNRSITAYMSQSSRWLAGLEEGSRMLSDLENLPGGDVFSRSQQAQAAVDKAGQLYASIDRARVPPSLSGLQARYRDAATLLLKAAQDGSTWALTQTEEDRAHFDAAQAALQAAIENLRQFQEGGTGA